MAEQYSIVYTHHSSVDGYLFASISWLLQIVLQWTSVGMYLFELWFSTDTCPGVGLLNHMVALINNRTINSPFPFTFHQHLDLPHLGFVWMANTLAVVNIFVCCHRGEGSSVHWYKSVYKKFYKKFVMKPSFILLLLETLWAQHTRSFLGL